VQVIRKVESDVVVEVELGHLHGVQRNLWVDPLFVEAIAGRCGF
jgi:hypothetical protein